MHAASFIRKREMWLDETLRRRDAEFQRILAHELFHFVWVRLSNRRRQEWEAVVAKEWARGARGELGWSAEHRKAKLSSAHQRNRSRLWREYICESFCDSAAWWLSRMRSHDEWTLAQRHCAARARFFDNLLRAYAEGLPI